MPSVVRVEPRPHVKCGDYELDAFAVELDKGTLDFRLELGMNLAIYWALPAARNDRLRLALVDGAAFHVDEPMLEADPFVFDFPRTEWRGELGTLADGSTVSAIVFAASVQPPAYRCEIELRRTGGDTRVETFAWRGRGADVPRA